MTTTTEQRTGQWEPHQFDTRPDGYPRYISGPHITPETFDDGLYRAQGCAVIGWCAADRHDQCWQANDAPPIDHDPEQCTTAAPEGHRLRCRCNCHTTSPHDHGRLF